MAQKQLGILSLLTLALGANCGGAPSSADSEQRFNPDTEVDTGSDLESEGAGDPNVAPGAAMNAPAVLDQPSMGPAPVAPAGAAPAGAAPVDYALDPNVSGTTAAPVPLPPADLASPVVSTPGAGEASAAGGAGPSAGVTPTTDVIAEPEPETLAEDPVAVEPALPATNPFVDTSYDPLSTFAVDVDTASYDIFRRDVLAGYLPGASQVRLEEFVNFFSYDYPAPEPGAEEPFSISLAAAPNLVDNGTTLLRVGIQGELAPDFEKRPANIVFLVDVSGSMQSAEKLPLVQRVLTQTLEVLDPSDTVSIVTYASGTAVELAPTPVSEAAQIADVIASLSASGSTNGAGGIQLAYDQAEAAYIDGGINHVVLATDGDFNVGVSDTAGLVSLIEEKRETGVTFTALGFGASNNDAMMELVSNAGNGVYGVIADQEQADRYVAERMLHNLVFIAKDVKIQVEFNPEHVAAYRLLGYENRAIADVDFRNDVVDAGEIGAGHRVTALYELVLAGAQVPMREGAPEVETGEPYIGDVEIATDDLVLVKVRYKDVDATAEDAAYEVARTLNPQGIAASHTDLDADFQWALAIATFAEVLKQSPYVTAAQLDEIDGIVTEQASRDDDRAEFAELYASARQLLGAAP